MATSVVTENVYFRIVNEPTALAFMNGLRELVFLHDKAIYRTATAAHHTLRNTNVTLAGKINRPFVHRVYVWNVSVRQFLACTQPVTDMSNLTI